MPQFWIATFFILLAVAELYQSAQNINLPFSVYLVLGVVLAVASNAHKQFSFGDSQQVNLQEVKAPTPTPVPTPTAIAAVTTESLPAAAIPTTPEITPAPTPTQASATANKPAAKKKSRPRKAKAEPKSSPEKSG